MRIAIDIGGVIFQSKRLAGEDIPELVAYTQEALTELVNAGHELWILSFCNPRATDSVRMALRYYELHDWIPEARWLFVSAPTLKGPTMKAHGLTHLIDDNAENVARICAEGLSASLFDRANGGWLSVLRWAKGIPYS